jgi:pimeloyl-ACP methyl ester carboxylesterase
MATFVLVHGAFHGGWCWYRIVPILEARGHKVIAPDLPGHARSASQPASLESYVDHVAQLVSQQPEKVVLVGHSMGGAVITGVGEALPEKISHLVYVTAFLAANGESMSGELSARPTQGGLLPIAAAMGNTLYHDCSAEDVALARLCLTPQPHLPLIEPINWTPELWGTIPRTFVGCAHDRVFAIENQRRRANLHRGTRWIELACGHSPFFAMPTELANLLEDAATSGPKEISA